MKKFNTIACVLFALASAVQITAAPIHDAARRGDIQEVKRLITSGADVNAKSKDGYTPLYFAAANGCTQVVQLLIGAGADVSAEDAKDLTLLNLAKKKGHMEVVIELLLADSAYVDEKINSVHEAAESGSIQTAQLLKEVIYSINKKEGWTPLHQAAFLGYENVVRLLLEYGYDVNAKITGMFMKTPLHWAAFRGYKNVVRLLLEHGADANEKDEFDMIPLCQAADHGHTQIVELLLSARADANVKEDNCYLTSLHRATEKGHTQVVRLLIEAGVDVNTKDEEGYTPLHKAAKKGPSEIIRLLTKAGADVNETDPNGETALITTARRGHNECVKLLLAHGADIDHANKYGWSAPMIAIYYGDKECTQTLLEKFFNVKNKCVHTLIEKFIKIHQHKENEETAPTITCEQELLNDNATHSTTNAWDQAGAHTSHNPWASQHLPLLGYGLNDEATSSKAYSKVETINESSIDSGQIETHSRSGIGMGDDRETEQLLQCLKEIQFDDELQALFNPDGSVGRASTSAGNVSLKPPHPSGAGA